MINIRSKLTYQFVGLVSTVLILFSFGVYFFSKLYLEKRFFNRLQDKAITTATLLFDLQTSDKTILKLVNISEKSTLSDESIYVYDEANKKLVFESQEPYSALFSDLIPTLQKQNKEIFFEASYHQTFAIKLKKGKLSYWIIVRAIDGNAKEALEDLRKILFVMGWIGVLLLGLSGWFFADKALAPMAGIIRQVNDIFPSNVEKRVTHPNKTDEIGLLVSTFNHLLDRIEQAFVMQKMFIANVSHELKNPLTKIYAQLEVSLLQQRSPAVYENTLRSLQEDTRSIIQLTNTLLTLANTVIDHESVQFSAIRVDELLWDAKTQLQKWHEEYKVQLNFDEFPEDEEALIILGNEASLKVVFMNLMDNACKFSPNHTVSVHFLANLEHITIRFCNSGNRIPEDELPFIFNPFFRSNSTAKAVKGHGVGLAIVSQVIKLHQANIEVQSDENTTIFTIKLCHISK